MSFYPLTCNGNGGPYPYFTCDTMVPTGPVCYFPNEQLSFQDGNRFFPPTRPIGFDNEATCRDPFVGFSNFTSDAWSPEDDEFGEQPLYLDSWMGGSGGCDHCSSISTAWRSGVLFGATMNNTWETWNERERKHKKSKSHKREEREQQKQERKLQRDRQRLQESQQQLKDEPPTTTPTGNRNAGKSSVVSGAESEVETEAALDAESDAISSNTDGNENRRHRRHRHHHHRDYYSEYSDLDEYPDEATYFEQEGLEEDEAWYQEYEDGENEDDGDEELHHQRSKWKENYIENKVKSRRDSVDVPLMQDKSARQLRWRETNEKEAINDEDEQEEKFSLKNSTDGQSKTNINENRRRRRGTDGKCSGSSFAASSTASSTTSYHKPGTSSDYRLFSLSAKTPTSWVDGHRKSTSTSRGYEYDSTLDTMNYDTGCTASSSCESTRTRSSTGSYAWKSNPPGKSKTSFKKEARRRSV